ncbi:hypothetical protein V8C43DRAFT_281756 [Trichoderma afarasin]
MLASIDCSAIDQGRLSWQRRRGERAERSPLAHTHRLTDHSNTVQKQAPDHIIEFSPSPSRLIRPPALSKSVSININMDIGRAAKTHWRYQKLQGQRDGLHSEASRSANLEAQDGLQYGKQVISIAWVVPQATKGE